MRQARWNIPVPQHISPDRWRLPVTVSFVRFNKNGRKILIGYSNGKVKVLDRNAKVIISLKCKGLLTAGEFLNDGFVVYEDKHLIKYNFKAKLLWKTKALTIYRIVTSENSKKLLCGSTGGQVLQINSNDGKILWKTDLHSHSIGNINTLNSAIEAMNEGSISNSEVRLGELDMIKNNVRLSKNLLATPISTENSKGQGWKVNSDNSISLGAKAKLSVLINKNLKPYSSYLFSLHWKSLKHGSSILLSCKYTDKENKIVEYTRKIEMSGNDWEEVLLPVKTGSKPIKIELSAATLKGKDISIKRIAFQKMVFGAKNLTFMPAIYKEGVNKKSRIKASRQLKIEHRFVDGNMYAFGESMDVHELIDGRIFREKGSKWVDFNEQSGLHGLELIFNDLKTFDTIVFYDDPTKPNDYLKQYKILYFDEGQIVKKEEENEGNIDQLEFTDKLKGSWKELVTVRDWRGSVHVHRLPKLFNARRIQIFAIANQNQPERYYETRIAEVELYQSSWPTAAGTMKRNAYAVNGGISGKLKVTPFKNNDGRYAHISPVYSKGILFQAAGFTLRAVNMSDDSILWTYETEDRKAIRSVPTLTNNKVIFGSDDFMLRALDVNSGKLIWSVPTEFVITGSPCVAGNKIIFGSIDGFLYCVDSKTGKNLWTFEAGLGIRGDISSDGKSVYFGSDNHKIYSVNIDSGKVIWSFNTKGPIRSSVVYSDNHVYAGSDDGKLYALNSKNGKTLWSYTTGDYIEAAPAVDENTVYIGSLDGIFKAFHKTNGKLKWQLKTSSAIRKQTLIWGEQVFLYNDDGTIYQLNKNDGSEISKGKSAYGKFLSAITPFGSKLLIGTRRLGYCAIEGLTAKK